VPVTSRAHLITQVVRRLLDKPSARVVIVFLRVEDAGALLRATRRLNETDRFVWIASDGWGKEELPVVGGNEVAAEGALTIELQSTRLPEFDSYFRQLRPATNDRNPWFREYWERPAPRAPPPNLRLPSRYSREYWERAHQCSFDRDPRRNTTAFAYKVGDVAGIICISVYLQQCGLVVYFQGRSTRSSKN